MAWWLFVLALGAILAFVAVQFLGMISLAVFGYYATRPICNRIGSVVDSDRNAAVVTVLLILVPVVLLLLYVLGRIIQQVQSLVEGTSSASLVSQVESVPSLSAEQREQVKSFIQDPTSALSGQESAILENTEVVLNVLGAVSGALILLSLSVTLSYVLLARDSKLSDVFADLVGGRDTTVYAYAAAVDADLESIFFGNLLFAVIMAFIATISYWVTNLVAPEGLHIPMVLVLGFLTGITSLVPIVVGKLVYLPVVGYLTVQALDAGSGALTFVAIVLLVYFLILDIIPQSFLQPYVSGRRMDMMLLVFAYILGPMVFGWYGVFLFPIIVVLVLELIRIVLPDLLSGEAPKPAVGVNLGMGTDPREARGDVPTDESGPSVGVDAAAGGNPSSGGEDAVAGGNPSSSGDATGDPSVGGDGAARDEVEQAGEEAGAGGSEDVTDSESEGGDGDPPPG